MTPAEELGQAADKLDALLKDTAPDWEVDDDNHLGLVTIRTPYMIGREYRRNDRYEFTGPNDASTLYIAAMNPLVGKALAEWLRNEGFIAAEMVHLEGFTSVHALAIARLINGSAS